ncbi:DUF4270 family protein [Ferruginibacter albus]|uniref:DUF4270 family protein n=1 Tax=Ferruginibacter albus TaxID=2875540 RepID=UPI001CC5DA2C|nr:DUF4270 family protein [Ferruginibacter albus]UAY51066.1 DUF4270 domain-containing protein [Ferruginibacter albus]
MQKKVFSFFSITIVFLLLINAGCTKITTTDVGGDLIPAVDNVHTFDTAFTVNATQGMFTNDSTVSGAYDNVVFGSISNDPVFGKTTANAYLQLKPPFFPYYFGNSGDTLIGLDSVVLCLSFRGYYGDTTLPQHFSVYEIPTTADFGNFGNVNKDSAYFLNYQPSQVSNTAIGSVTIDVRSLKNYIFLAGGTDSVNNQIRIKLSSDFANKLWNMDSSNNPLHNAFVSDSLFKTFFNGFAIVADPSSGGNGLFYTNFTDATTRLEVHYRKQRNNVIDTAYSSLVFTTDTTSTASMTACAHANYLKRDYAGAEINSPQPDALYIQATPGSYATIAIPDLQNFANCIVHRAELSFEEIPGNQALDNALKPPTYLYFDLVDTPSSNNKFKPVYYDLNPYDAYDPDNSTVFLPSSGINYNYFGGVSKFKTDGSGNNIAYYNFNLSRYVQHIVTNKLHSYNIRLYAPFELKYYNILNAFGNSLAYGRVKIGGPGNTAHPMRFHIIYSKL